MSHRLIFFATCSVVLAAFSYPPLAPAQPAPRPTTTAAAPTSSASAGGSAPFTGPISNYARDNGFRRCANAIGLAERNLLSNSEYSFRAFHRAKTAGDPDVMSFIVDARKLDPLHPAPRATLNLTVTASNKSAAACSTFYEQTVYHNANCEIVLSQMAPNGRDSGKPAVGSVLIEVSPNLTLTLIPVGTAQCITITKEAAFDVSTLAAR
jgi:hypothetical protein